MVIMMCINKVRGRSMGSDGASTLSDNKRISLIQVVGYGWWDLTGQVLSTTRGLRIRKL